jgi:hypothetical protein
MASPDGRPVVVTLGVLEMQPVTRTDTTTQQRMAVVGFARLKFRRIAVALPVGGGSASSSTRSKRPKIATALQSIPSCN